MKTSFKRIISFSLLTLMILSFPMSCVDQGVDKQENSQREEQVKQEDAVLKALESWKYVSNCDISNPQNPFDEAGLLHNERLALIESRCTPDMTLDEVYEQADLVIKSGDQGKIIPNFSSKEFSTPILTALETEGGLAKHFQTLNISANQRKEALALTDILYLYNAQNLCDIIKEIKTFEDGLLRRYGAEEMEQVLIAASVARYSLAYWDDRLEPENEELSKKFWKKLFVGIADVVGAVGGAIAGSATVVGGIAGGITGAIGASAGAGSVWNVFAN